MSNSGRETDEGRLNDQENREFAIGLSEEGFVNWITPALCRVLQLDDTQDMQELSFLQLVVPEERGKAVWLLEQVKIHRKPVRFDVCLRGQKASLWECEGLLGPDEAGLGLIFKANRTAPTKQEQSRRADEVTLKVCHMVFSKEEGVWKAAGADSSSCAFLGYTEEELKGQELTELLNKEAHPDFYRDVDKKGKGFFKADIKSIGGEKIPADISYLALSQQDSLSLLIKPKLSWEKQEKENQEETDFTALAEHSPDLIVRYNQNGERIYVNPAFTLLTGLSREELTGKSELKTGVFTDDPKKLTALMKRVFDTQQPQEAYFSSKGDKKRHFHTRMVPELSSDGTVKTVLKITKDITEQKQKEKERKKSDTLGQDFIEGFHGIAFMGDGSFRPRYIKGKVYELTGYTEEELLSGQVLWKDLVHPDDFDELWEKIQKNRKTPRQEHTRQYRILKKDGQIRWVEQHIQYFTGREDDSLITHGTIYDITERKEIEKGLKKSKKHYQLLVENIQDAIYRLDEEGKIIYISPAVEAMTGFRPDEMVGESVLSFIWPEDVDKVKKNIEQKRKKKLVITEHRIKTKSGNARYVRAFTRSMPNEEEGEGGLYGIMSDITEERRAREDLRRREVQFRSLVANIPGVVYRVVPQEEEAFIAFVSDNCKDVLGVSSETLKEASLKEFYKIILSEDREQVKEVFQKVRSKKDPYMFEVRIRMPDGSVRWVQGRGQGSWSKDGNLEYIDGVLMDITEQKNLEEELRFSELQFRSLADNVPGIFYRAAPTEGFPFVYLSNDFKDITGYEPEEFLGDDRRHYHDIIYETDRQQVAVAFQEAVDKKEEFVKDYRIVRKDGDLRWMQGRAKGLYEKGRLVFIDGIITDIQKRKEAEEKVEYLTFHDRMTGLYNRNFFDVELKRLDVERMLPLSIIMGDVNSLKLVNDSLGHHKGDEMLTLIGRSISETCRQEDIVCRWGGDEFAILLPKTWPKEAEVILSRIKKRCRSIREFPVPISISLGAATKKEQEESVRETIQEAEKAMYRQKLKDAREFSQRMVFSLKEYMHTKTDESAEHNRRLRKYALLMAGALALTDEETKRLEILADFHDLGKLVVPEEIMFKAGPLNKEERSVVQGHCEHGSKIIQSAANLMNVAEDVLSHHEWYDGSGYPQGLKGKEIPLLARIFSIVDAYDVMTSERAYRKTMRDFEARAELKKCAGSQFDPDLVNVFLTVTEEFKKAD